MDGPNIERLFLETDCLTAQSNLEDICRYLRFFKGQENYQAHLAKYLPKLAKPEYKEAFDEFIGDYEDKEVAKQLEENFSIKKEEPEVVPEKVEIVPEEANEISEESVEEATMEAAPKKRGRKPKVS